MHCRHVLLGKAELDSLEADLTRLADNNAELADRIAQLENAVADHRTATLLARDGDDMAHIDDRLWGVLF